jgi:hypothetical protein
MHNRLRMITAMFLTKDLMIDWRLGERVCYPCLFIPSTPYILTEFFSTLARISSTPTWPLTTVAGNGQRLLVQTRLLISVL